MISALSGNFFQWMGRTPKSKSFNTCHAWFIWGNIKAYCLFYHFSTPKWNRKIETAPHWKPGACLSCTVKHICNDHLFDKIYHDQYHCPWLLGDLMSISSHGVNSCISEYTSLSTRMFKNLALHCLYVHKCVFSRTSSYTHAFYEQALYYRKYSSRYHENTKQTKTTT